MANLRVFVSSTAYDLNIVRAQLRSFIQSLGYEPVMSEYSDVLYDPRVHTHTSCLKEVPGCDMVVLIIGSRFGGTAVPEALSDVDFDSLRERLIDVEALLADERQLSITQIEVLKAIEESVPVVAFVDERVHHDHLVYEKNRNNDRAAEIIYPSIEKPDTAAYVFGFIDFLRHRAQNNALVPFAKMEDIEEHLRKQWAALFQRLLHEERNKVVDEKRIDRVSEQLEDLKTAVLTTMGDAQTRDIARGVVRFRLLVDFLRSLPQLNWTDVIDQVLTWEQILAAGGVQELDIGTSQISHRQGPCIVLLMEDGSSYETRMSPERFQQLAFEWKAFTELSEQGRRVILDTLNEGNQMRMGALILRRDPEPEPTRSQVDPPAGAFSGYRPSPDDVPF